MWIEFIGQIFEKDVTMEGSDWKFLWRICTWSWFIKSDWVWRDFRKGCVFQSKSIWKKRGNEKWSPWTHVQEPRTAEGVWQRNHSWLLNRPRVSQRVLHATASQWSLRETKANSCLNSLIEPVLSLKSSSTHFQAIPLSFLHVWPSLVYPDPSHNWGPCCLSISQTK